MNDTSIRTGFLFASPVHLLRGGMPVVAAFALFVLSCAPNQATLDGGRQRNGPEGELAPGASNIVAPDTLRGTVAIVGSYPTTLVVLRPLSGEGDVMLHGEPVTDLRQLSGVEVLVAGRDERPADRKPQGPPSPGTKGFVVEEFSVRAVDGIPAVDGILIEEDSAFYLRLSDGSLRRVAHLPPDLRQKVGSWVWLSGSLDRDVAAFGIIRER